MRRLRCVANVHEHRRSGSDFADSSVGARAKYWPDRETAARQFRVEDRTQTDQFLSPRILRTVAKTEFRFLAQWFSRGIHRHRIALCLERAGSAYCYRWDDETGTLPGKRAPARITPVTRERIQRHSGAMGCDRP